MARGKEASLDDAVDKHGAQSSGRRRLSLTVVYFSWASVWEVSEWVRDMVYCPVRGYVNVYTELAVQNGGS